MEKDYKNKLDDILTDLNMIKTELKSKSVNKKHEELMLCCSQISQYQTAENRKKR